MSKVFEDVVVEYGGETKTIRANNVLRLIAQIEEILTLAEITGMTEKKDVNLTKISACYGLLLRHAGFDVQDDETYEIVLRESIQGGVESVMALMMLLIPPSMRKEAEKQVEESEPQSTPQKKTRSKSSKQRTKR